MTSESPNRAASDLLPSDLLAAAARAGLLASPLPAMVLAGPRAEVRFAAHAFARRLGEADGGALMAHGLPRLAPGTERLTRLAEEPPETRRAERLRFVVAHRTALIPVLVEPLPLADGTTGLLVMLAPEGGQMPGNEAPALAVPPARAVRPSRFVFTLDREGFIDTLSPAFGEALGIAPEALRGQALASIAAAFSPEAGTAIDTAVAAGQTWGGVRLDWPLATEGLSVPVVLSAMPLHGEAGVSGFSGFGRLLFDEARALTPPRATPIAPPVPAPEAAPVAAAAPLPEPVPETSVVETPAVEAPVVETPVAAAEPPAPVVEAPAPAEPASAPQPAPADDLARALDAFAEDDAEAIDVSSVAPAEEPPPVVAAPVGEAPAAPPAAAPEAPQEAPKVVSLRPGQMDLPPGLPPHLARPGLSMNERNAFREIARALGARFEAEGQEGATPHESNEAAPAVPAPEAGVEAGSAAEAPLLVDALPIGVLVLRGEETVFVNRTLLDLAGYADLADFNAGGGAGALFRKGAMPREREAGFETVVLAARDGTMIPVDAHLQRIAWNAAPASLISFRRAIELEQGKALASVAHDLKRTRAEAGELRAILDTATDGVVTLDEAGAILGLNHAAEALFGLDQNEVIGMSFLQLLHSESHAAALDYFEGLKANGVRSILNDGREVAGREKKGGHIPLFLTLGRVSEEEPRRYCAVLRDMTAFKRAETELTEARRAAENASAKKSDFLAKIGHEIRTPMNAIIGFAEVMQEERLGPVGNAKYKEYLGDIRASGLHVVSLVNDLLDLSKIEAGRMELNFAATDLNAVVSSCVGLIQPQATRFKVLVRSQLAAQMPPVVADERSIRQIMLNLLSNATRFTPVGGQVLVATALQESGEAVIRIRDTGVGMSANEIEQALESYRQVGTKRESGGTGLGLPLSKALTEANRASFSIRSVPGEGTTVEISFPPTRVLAE